MNYTKSQQEALNSFKIWIKEVKLYGKGNFILDGYAGTGKTWLLREFMDILDENRLTSASISYTGKAATVMKEKTGRPSCTIHSLIYEWELTKDFFNNTAEEEKEFAESKAVTEVLKSKAIVIDEYSMLDEEMLNDILSLDKIIIWAGDMAQLPPIKEKADLKELIEGYGYAELVEIRRQSGKDNPILKLAEKIRNGTTNFIDFKEKDDLGNSIMVGKEPNIRVRECADKNTIILCFKNTTRRGLNKRVRDAIGFIKELPMINEKMIVLKNNKPLRLYNGEIIKISTIEEVQTYLGLKYFDATIFKQDEDYPRFIRVWADPFFNGGDYYFNQEDYEDSVLPKEATNKDEDDFLNFVEDKLKRLRRDRWNFFKKLVHLDFGYAITVHKAQGSQWERVIVLSNDYTKSDKHKWLYTAVTRAEKELIIRT